MRCVRLGQRDARKKHNAQYEMTSPLWPIPLLAGYHHSRHRRNILNEKFTYENSPYEEPARSAAARKHGLRRRSLAILERHCTKEGHRYLRRTSD